MGYSGAMAVATIAKNIKKKSTSAAIVKSQLSSPWIGGESGLCQVCCPGLRSYVQSVLARLCCSAPGSFQKKKSPLLEVDGLGVDGYSCSRVNSVRLHLVLLLNQTSLVKIAPVLFHNCPNLVCILQSMSVVYQIGPRS